MKLVSFALQGGVTSGGEEQARVSAGPHPASVEELTCRRSRGLGFAVRQLVVVAERLPEQRRDGGVGQLLVPGRAG